MSGLWMRRLSVTPAPGLVAGPLQAGPGGDGYHGHMTGWGMGLGFGMMVLFWVALIVAAVLLIRWMGERGHWAERKSDALETLKQRLARGEIDIEDYEARRKALEG